MGTTVPLLMGDGLRRNAQKFPLKIAAKDKQRETTYGELNRRVNQLANGLTGLGVRKGDAVALSVGNCIEHLEIVFATAKIGALAIPLDVKWKALELASVLTALAPRFVILQEDGAAEFEKVARSIGRPEDVLSVEATLAGWQGRFKTYETLWNEVVARTEAAGNKELAATLRGAKVITLAVYRRGADLQTLKNLAERDVSDPMLVQYVSTLAAFGEIEAAKTGLRRLESQAKPGEDLGTNLQGVRERAQGCGKPAPVLLAV